MGVVWGIFGGKCIVVICEYYFRRRVIYGYGEITVKIVGRSSFLGMVFFFGI